MAVTDMSAPEAGKASLVPWRRIWSLFDKIYAAAGYLAAFCMVMIFAVTMFQMVGRYVDYNPPGLTNYVGYLTGAATFLSLAYALNRGSHVRVNLFLTLSGRFRPFMEIGGFIVSCTVGLWFSWYCWSTVYDSFRFGDLSEGLDATPIWIPQTSMAVGVSLLAIAACDHFLRLLVTGETGIVSVDEPV